MTSSIVVSVRNMTKAEARHVVESIKDHLSSARTQLLELYERKGWKALGYATWRECAQTEFEFSQSQVYRLLSAAKIERVISPIGETVPESHLRELAVLTEDEQRHVWEVVKKTAPKGKVTASHIKSIINVVSEMTVTHAVPDGSGSQIEVSKVFEAAVADETYERLMRQQEHIAEHEATRTTGANPPAHYLLKAEGTVEAQSVANGKAGRLVVRTPQVIVLFTDPELAVRAGQKVFVRVLAADEE